MLEHGNFEKAWNMATLIITDREQNYRALLLCSDFLVLKAETAVHGCLMSTRVIMVRMRTVRPHRGVGVKCAHLTFRFF